MDDVLAVSAGRPDRRVLPSADGDRERTAGRFEDVIGAAEQRRAQEDGRVGRAASGPRGGRDRSADVAARSAETQSPRPEGTAAKPSGAPSGMPATKVPADVPADVGAPGEAPPPRGAVPPAEPSGPNAVADMPVPVSIPAAVPPPVAPRTLGAALPVAESGAVAAPAGGMPIAGPPDPAPGGQPVAAGPAAGDMAGKAAEQVAGEMTGEKAVRPGADAGSAGRAAEAKGEPVPRVQAGKAGTAVQPAPAADTPVVGAPTAGAPKGPAMVLAPAVAEYVVQGPGGGPDIGPATGPRANAPAAAVQVAEQLVRVVQPGRNQFQIDLTPAELGRVRIEADVTEGRVTLTVQAERAETLDLLRADMRVLERALGDAGLKFDPSSVQFSLRGDDQPRGFALSGGTAQERHRDGGDGDGDDGGRGGHRPDAGDPVAEPVLLAIDGTVDLIV